MIPILQEKFICILADPFAVDSRLHGLHWFPSSLITVYWGTVWTIKAVPTRELYVHPLLHHSCICCTHLLPALCHPLSMTKEMVPSSRSDALFSFITYPLFLLHQGVFPGGNTCHSGANHITATKLSSVSRPCGIYAFRILFYTYLFISNRSRIILCRFKSWNLGRLLCFYYLQIPRKYSMKMVFWCHLVTKVWTAVWTSLRRKLGGKGCNLNTSDWSF